MAFVVFSQTISITNNIVNTYILDDLWTRSFNTTNSMTVLICFMLCHLCLHVLLCYKMFLCEYLPYSYINCHIVVHLNHVYINIIKYICTILQEPPLVHTRSLQQTQQLHKRRPIPFQVNINITYVLYTSAKINMKLVEVYIKK